MTKSEITVILITASTDFIIGAFGSLLAALAASGSTAMPTNVVLLIAAGTGAIAFARTIQQQLRKYNESVVTSTTTTIVSPPPPQP